MSSTAVDLGISLAGADAVDTFAASSMADALSDTGIPEWQIYYGFIAGLSPFVIAAYEFGKRIIIQRQCELCRGSGLIQKGRYSRKCTSCGGFLPWQSWELFFTSDAGNGSRVRAPKGQTSVFYDVEAARRDGAEQAARAREREAAAGAAKARVKPSSLASIDFDDDMFVGAGAGPGARDANVRRGRSGGDGGVLRQPTGGDEKDKREKGLRGRPRSP